MNRQAIFFDLDHAQTPEKRDEWYRFCGQIRDRDGLLNRAVRAADKEGTARALRDLGQSCEACHAAFR